MHITPFGHDRKGKRTERPIGVTGIRLLDAGILFSSVLGAQGG